MARAVKSRSYSAAQKAREGKDEVLCEFDGTLEMSGLGGRGGGWMGMKKK